MTSSTKNGLPSALSDQIAHALRKVFDVEQVAEQLLRMCGVEGLEHDLGKERARSLRALLMADQLGASLSGRSRQTTRGQFPSQLRHVQQEVERGAVRPVQIVENDDHWRLVGLGSEVALDRLRDVIYQRVALQRGDRFQRGVALDGEHYVKELQVTLRNRGASGSRRSLSRTTSSASPSFAPTASRMICRQG